MDARVVRAVLPFLVGAIACFAWAIYGHWYASSIERWPTTDGRVTNARSIADGTKRWALYIQFTYTVGAQTYAGHDQELSTADRDAVEGEVTRYPGGTKVTVHYDPTAPNTATIFLHHHTSNGWFPWFIGGLFVVTGGVAWRRRRRAVG